jgi:hypothetical protein
MVAKLWFFENFIFSFLHHVVQAICALVLEKFMRLGGFLTTATFELTTICTHRKVGLGAYWAAALHARKQISSCSNDIFLP